MSFCNPAALLLTAALVGAPLASAADWEAAEIWGREGTRLGEFHHPMGLAIDHRGHVFVTDTENRRVQELDEGGHPIGAWGEDILARPVGIAVASSGEILVSDFDLDEVFRFRSSGKLLGRWGRAGSRPGEFQSPVAVAVAPGNAVYVLEFEGHRVQRFDLLGKQLGGWGELSPGGEGGSDSAAGSHTGMEAGSGRAGSAGSHSAQAHGSGNAEGRPGATFVYPAGIASYRRSPSSPGERIYVSDTHNQRIQVFDTEGRFLRSWGRPGHGPGELADPVGLAVTPRGNVVVAERANHRLQVFDTEGRSLAIIGGKGADAGEFDSPTDVAVDAQGMLYVTDWGNHRIQLFRPVPRRGGAIETQHEGGRK